VLEGWIIRDAAGRVLGHFSASEAAEFVAELVARPRGDDLVIELADSGSLRKTLGKSWLGSWLVH
jgi:hypothetical protein